MPVNTTIQIRKGTATQWSSTNPVLGSGEPGFDTTNKLLKIGDGDTSWNLLPSIFSMANSAIFSNADMLNNVVYDSVSFSVAAQENLTSDLFFSPDGLKMYIIGTQNKNVNEYNLSTPWVVSSAAYSTAFSVTSQDILPQGIFFRADGLKMYVVGGTSDTVFQYSLNTPWSTATASYDSISFSVTTQETNPQGVFFKPNGLSMYVVGPASDAVHQYTLSTAWSVSSATFLRSFSILSQEGTSRGLCFTGDGSQMFVIGTSSGISLYSLSTPWNISTATYVGGVNISSQDAASVGIYIKPDGTKMYVLGNTSDVVYQHTTSNIDIQLTGQTSVAALDVQQDLNVYGKGNFTTLTLGKSDLFIAGSAFAGGRLTLESAVPISTTNQTAKTTIYYTPYNHSIIGLYNTTTLVWNAHTFTERSLSLGTLTSGFNYDIFIYNNAGTLTLASSIWTSNTARATAISLQDGVYVKTSDKSYRYLGTFRTTTTTTTEDSEAKRFVYNVNNQVPRHSLGVLGYVNDNAAVTFTLSSLNTWVALNGGTGNKCEWVNGLASTCMMMGQGFATAGTGGYVIIGIGIDSTTNGDFIVLQSDGTATNAFARGASKAYVFTLGYHYISLNGYTTAGTATIYKEDSRNGGTVDPIRTWIAAQQNM